LDKGINAILSPTLYGQPARIGFILRPLILYYSEFLTEIRDTHTLAVSQSGTHIGFTALQDYATVLFPLPGISNDLEVVGVCLPESKLADSIVLRQFR
jgi:hypothetical protein